MSGGGGGGGGGGGSSELAGEVDGLVREVRGGRSPLARREGGSSDRPRDFIDSLREDFRIDERRDWIARIESDSTRRTESTGAIRS